MSNKSFKQVRSDKKKIIVNKNIKSGFSLSSNSNVHNQVFKWWFSDEAPSLINSSRKGFGNELLRLARSNDRIIALTANLESSTSLTSFHKTFPDRFFDVGVAEQSLAGISAGLAAEGFLPVMTSFAVFNPGRNWDFIRSQIVMNNLPVIIVGSHAGIATGHDGATHQALEDVALMRSLPNVFVLSPADYNDTSLALRFAVKLKKPVYLRLVREKSPVIFKKKGSFKPFSWLLPLSSSKIINKRVVIVATGNTLWVALNSAKLLWRSLGLKVAVLNVSLLKPFPIIKELLSADLVFSLEDHNVVGGLGSAIAEFLSGNASSARLVRLGLDSFGDSGPADELYSFFGIDFISVAFSVLDNLNNKKLFSSLRSFLKKKT